MNFCVVLGHYPKETPGGAEYQAYLIARELAARDHETHYIAFRSGPAKTYADEGVTVHYLDTSYSQPDVPESIIQTVHSIDPTHVYFRNYADLYVLQAVTYSVSCETIFNISHDRQCHSLRNNWRSVLTPGTIYQKLTNPRTLFQRRLLTVPDHLFAQTTFQQRLLRENHSLDSHYTGNGHPAPSETPTKSDPPIVLWLASLKQWKQPEKFLDIAEQCSDLDCRFWLVGRPVNESYTEQLLERVETLRNVEYKGGCDIEESNDYIGQASLFVNTSIREGFPNTFIQSWLRGTPVLSLNVDPDGGLADRDTGALANGDLDRLAETVRSLIEGDERRNRYSENARQYGLENYTIETVVDRIEMGLLD